MNNTALQTRSQGFPLTYLPYQEIQTRLSPIQEDLEREKVNDEISNSTETKLGELVTALIPHIPLLKVFAKAVGSPTMLPQDCLAKSINSTTFSIAIPQLDRILTDRQKVLASGKEIVNKHFKHLQDFPVEVLDTHWYKSLQTFRRCQKVVADIDHFNQSSGSNESRNLTQIKAKLLVWGLHFLARGSKIPILDKFRLPQHLPYIEYFDSNDTNYYRGDGGVIMDLFIKTIGVTEAFCLPVRKQCYDELINACCNNLQCMEVKYTSSLRAFKQESFVNMTDEFRGLSSIAECVDTAKKFWEKFGSNEQQVAVGGVKSYCGLDIFICYPKKENSLGEIIADEFKDFQGANGFYPDMVALKHSLTSIPFALPFEPPFSPLNTKEKEIVHTSIDQVQIKWKEVLEIFNSASPSFTSPVSHCYLPILRKLMKSLDIENFKPTNNFAVILVMKELRNLEKGLQKLTWTEASNYTPREKFHISLQEIYLLFESVIHLMNFCKVSGNVQQNYSVIDVLQKLSPQVLNEGIQKHSFTTTSGMSSLGSIANTLADTLYQGKKPNTIFLQGCYYEIFENGGLKDILRGKVNLLSENGVSVDELLDTTHNTFLKECDILFCDLHPNFVTLPSVRTTPVNELLGIALNGRNPNKPFTLVLDVATTLFFHEEVSKLINDAKIARAIQDGCLVIATAASLAKFPSIGLDKYTGGVIQVYAANKPQFESFISSFIARTEKDPFSDEALKFFYLLLSRCSDEILTYFESIRKNTNYVYDMLADKGLVDGREDIALRIGRRENREIMMLGIQFDGIIDKIKADEESTEVLALLMQYYIFTMYAARRLPIAMRASFGFPTTTIVEASTAVRMAVGLEDQDMLNEYVEILAKLNNELVNQLNNTQSQSNLRAALSSVNDVKKLKKNIFQRHATIVDMAAGRDFIDFIVEAINAFKG